MKLKVTVEGKIYEVDVEVEEAQAPVGAHAVAPRPAVATSHRPATPAVSASEGPTVADGKALKSPLMGVVQALECAAGDEVAAEQPLVVLEAMKMLTTITSPGPAKIKNLFVAVGDSVKQGQIIVEFE